MYVPQRKQKSIYNLFNIPNSSQCPLEINNTKQSPPLGNWIKFKRIKPKNVKWKYRVQHHGQLTAKIQLLNNSKNQLMIQIIVARKTHDQNTALEKAFQIAPVPTAVMEPLANSTAGKSLKRLEKLWKLEVLRMVAGDEELSGRMQFSDYMAERSPGQMFLQPPSDPFSCFDTLQKLIKMKKHGPSFGCFPRWVT